MTAEDEPLNGLYDTARLARKLGIAESSVRAYVANGRLPKPTGYLGGNVWDEAAIEEHLANRKPARRGRPPKNDPPV